MLNLFSLFIKDINYIDFLSKNAFNNTDEKHIIHSMGLPVVFFFIKKETERRFRYFPLSIKNRKLKPNYVIKQPAFSGQTLQMYIELLPS